MFKYILSHLNKTFRVCLPGSAKAGNTVDFAWFIQASVVTVTRAMATVVFSSFILASKVN